MSDLPGAEQAGDRGPQRMARALTFFVAARLTMNAAHRFTYPFLPAISRGLGVSLAGGGLLLSVRSLAGLATPALVTVAGRGRRRVRILFTGLILFSLGTLFAAATSTYAAALIGFALMGVAKLGFDVAARAYVADRTPYERRGWALGILETTWSLALLVGAPVAGWMIGTWGWRSPFWAAAALGAAGAAGLRWVVEPDVPAAPGSRVRLRLSAPGAALALATTLPYFSTTLILVVFGAWLEDRFGLSLLELGGAAVLLAVAELVAVLVVLRVADRLGPRRVAVIGTAGSGLAFLLLPPLSGRLGPALAVLVVAFFFFEAAWTAAMPLATVVGGGSVARYLAWLVAVGAAAEMLGAALGPAMFDWGGLGLTSLVAAGGCLAALGLLLAAVHHR